MTEVYKRDQKASKLAKLCSIIERDGKHADLATVTVWVKQVNKMWTAFETLQEAVIDRSGSTELAEQEGYYDTSYDLYYRVSIDLEEMRAKLNLAASVDTDRSPSTIMDVEKLRIRFDMTVRRFETACQHARDGVEKMHAVDVRLAKAEVDELYTAMRECAMNIIVLGGEHDDVVKLEEEATIVHRQVLRLLMNAQAQFAAQPPANPNAAGAEADALKLPHLNIAPFDGQIEKWEAFRESFVHGIHNRANMPAIQKLQFLKGMMRNEPEELIRNFALSADNYESAWKLLNDRYNNKRELIRAHLRIITSLPACAETADDLRRLSNKTTSTLMALKNLGRPTDQWHDWVEYHVCLKLDPESRKQWEQSQSAADVNPTWEDLDAFIQGRIRALSCTIIERKSPAQTHAKPASKVRAHHAANSPEPAARQYVCAHCEQGHLISFCDDFRKMSPTERRRIAAEKAMCFICLSVGHMAQRCTSTRFCRTCNAKHNTLLHQPESNINEQQVRAHSTTCAPAEIRRRPRVLLATAMVHVYDARGEMHQLRALLDICSEGSMVSERAAQLLQCPRQRERAQVWGAGDMPGPRVSQSIRIRVSNGNGYEATIHAAILKRVSGNFGELPATCQWREWPHIRDVTLADPDFMRAHTVDLLLGSEIYGKLLLPGLRQAENLPTAQNTVFGWILSGEVSSTHASDQRDNQTIRLHHTTVDDQLARFWEVEETIQMRHKTADEEKCETFFEQTVSRDTNGRIHVRIPMKSDNVEFGESQRFAVQRQLQIERRFQTHPEFAAEYRKFMEQYIKLGHMREVMNAHVDMSRRCAMQSASRRMYYIPHHAVIKESSTTTKLRVVFDASRRTTTGTSLNERMLTGPRLQDDLTAIMMRWRQRRYAFVADIEKMYRQIVVDDPDTDLQRIVWRATPNEPMRVYQLCTVTYGTASAPYLAVKSLQTLAHCESERYPIGAEIALTNFYVDDVLAGADTVADCIVAQSQLIGLMTSGGLSLRKWASNSADVLAKIEPAHRECTLPLDIHDGSNISTLGVQWSPACDEMSFKIDVQTDDGIIWTKRSFLSTAARLYDPLGWLAPATINIKIMFQLLWKHQLEWDDKLPTELMQKWQEMHRSLQQLTNVRIGRWLGTMDGSEFELHGFCDASLNAYAAVVFVRVAQQSSQPARVVNICAKTKVAPIKTLSLPRLELCGAKLLANLVGDVIEAMKWPTVPVYCWTDSTIVLSWLRGYPSEFNVFVANRAADIQRKIPSNHWQHIASPENPADCASRGITPQQLVNHRLWWTGPHWLSDDRSRWPLQPPAVETTEEIRTRVHTVTGDVQGWELMSKYSSWHRLIRVTALAIRFARLCRTERISGPLRASELSHASDCLVRYAQAEAYTEELKCLRKKTVICKSSSLKSLNPILSKSQILCVGGRLANAQNIPNTARTPVIIPRRSALSALLIRHAHHQTLHGGPSLMLAYLRRAYWVIDGPKEVRQCVKKCTTCFRYAARPEHQQMAALPSARVVPSRPFRHCAMDYSGAMMVRSAKGRGHHATKCYVAAFVCLATKAIHIELVGDLSTAAFIAAYERFVARRGICSDLYSDNATNYVGAVKFLASERKLFNVAVHSALAERGTTWHFAPPLSPHFNGLAESAIRSIKHHVRRVIGETTLTFEELTTVLAKIEACVNSRPLCPMSSDPDDYDALTPGHFLIGEPITTIPQRDLQECRPSALTRWQLTHQLVQRFWARWSREYLHTLQQRRKWQQPTTNIQVGDMVLVIEDNMPPAKWTLGRIVDVHPGDDGNVRVVSIRTKGSVFKRSVVKIARLPIDVHPADNETSTRTDVDTTAVITDETTTEDV